jgi:sugar lactone lactonase YvrE
VSPRAEKRPARNPAAGRAAIAAALAIGALALSAGPAEAYVAAGRSIWSIAGNGLPCTLKFGPCGDGLSAIDASFDTPSGIAVAPNGTVYVGDTSNHKIRRILPTGEIATIAGSGAPCTPATATCGDGEAAAGAQLSSPRGLALDGAGNLYIADTGTHRVRRIAADGTITTVAGRGDVCSPSTAACGDGEAATAALLRNPRGVAVSGSTLYIADSGANRIRKVQGGTITTIAGTGNVCLGGTSPCGDGGSGEPSFNNPSAVAVDGAGNVYVADTYDNRIRRITPEGELTTVAGAGTTCATPTSTCGDGSSPTLAKLSNPFGVAVVGSTVYIADTNSHKIRRLAGGTISTLAGTGEQCFSPPSCGDGGAATAGTLGYPAALTATAAGDVFVADSADHLVRWLAGPGGAGTAPPVSPPVDPPPTGGGDPPPAEIPPAAPAPVPPPSEPAPASPSSRPASGPLIRCAGRTCRIQAGAATAGATDRLRRQAKAAQRGTTWSRVELRRNGRTVATGMGRTLAQALLLVPEKGASARPGAYRLRITRTSRRGQRQRSRIVKLV